VKNDTDSVISVKKITMSATVETSDANKKVDWATLFIRFRRWMDFEPKKITDFCCSAMISTSFSATVQ
jgi:hypothetical protein